MSDALTQEAEKSGENKTLRPSVDVAIFPLTKSDFESMVSAHS